ncbi:MAG: TIGR03013 family PEP-CTERM/XrtA system glycosyltransferase [Gammaproteobacteria bacterium]|nr:TIGR03013 family PEP-CTERM/XrtA system glycosyltransferase [Gammaproteobacteria bacterium]
MIRIFRHYIPKFLIVLGTVEALILFCSVYLGVAPPFVGPNPTRQLLVGELWSKAAFYAIIMMLAFSSVGLYQRDLSDEVRGLILRLAVALTGGSIATGVGMYLWPRMSIGVSAFLLALLISAICIVVFRKLVYQFSGYDQLKRRVLVLGAAERAASALSIEEAGEVSDIILVGFVHVRGEDSTIDRERRVYVQTNLLDLCLELQVEELVVAIDEEQVEFPVGQILDCKMHGVAVMDQVTFLEQQSGCLQLHALRPSTIVFAEGFVQAVVKGYAHRAFDLVVSACGLVLASPLMLLTALAIYAESGFRGPILYRQIRVGRNGRHFQILKFRSMRTDAELDGHARWAQENDSRITRIGGLLRKTRLDELPQLVNVLAGTMSFVGPRPERPEFVDSLSKEIPYFDLRHIVNPGITGWAQICYPYGASIEDARRKLEYDLYYIKNYSLFLDLAIMIQTAQVVLWGKGR